MAVLTPALGIALLIGGSVNASAQDSVSDVAPVTPPIVVVVDCESSPERVTITNHSKKPMKLKSVGSTYQRRAEEPYRVKKTLKPGKSTSYTFGAGRDKGRRLSGSYIFDNEATHEGVLVRTSRGRVRVTCAKGTNAPATRPAVLEVQPLDTVLGEPVDAVALLASLRVEPELEDGYERTLFRHWIDADGDGCDTRQEVLIAESATPAVIGDGCRVEGGTWYSAPDDEILTNPASVDINHVVPLQEAWASGAYDWSAERREAFANDLLDERTLAAVSSGANRQQGESDPASWLPADLDTACRFLIDWLAIKASWDLAVDEAERDAISVTLTNCPGREVTLLLRDDVHPAADQS